MKNFNDNGIPVLSSLPLLSCQYHTRELNRLTTDASPSRVTSLLSPQKVQFLTLILDVQKDEMLSKNLDSKLNSNYSHEKPNSERENAYQIK